MKPQRRHAQAGITLIEVLIVLAILGLVFGLVGPRVMDYFGRAKHRTAGLQIENIATGLDLYRLDVGRYPSQEEGLGALMARPAGPVASRWNGPYLGGTAMPSDPWDRPYVYRLPSRHGLAYDLYSLGADGREGGEGEDRDIGNWQKGR
ncbi:MAG: type II secretion system protein GspG [Alphaproteobacteria bacterium]|nr:type II secretion system protein GspG [Alphaproteobacteria bacterium]